MFDRFRGLPRVNAKAKDSEWVRQRQELEASKAVGVNEVLLVTPEGAVMEGLTSNFFVLSSAGEVETADAGVLSGTVRELVLQVCQELNVPVKLQPPQLSNIDSWQGAFISSTSRLLLPAAEVMYEGPFGHMHSKVFHEQHPILQQLEQRVKAEVVDSSEPLDDSGNAYAWAVLHVAPAPQSVDQCAVQLASNVSTECAAVVWLCAGLGRTQSPASQVSSVTQWRAYAAKRGPYCQAPVAYPARPAYRGSAVMLGPPCALASAAMGSVLLGSAVAQGQVSVAHSAAGETKYVLR
eukprot:gene5354-5590_t